MIRACRRGILSTHRSSLLLHNILLLSTTIHQRGTTAFIIPSSLNSLRKPLYINRMASSNSDNSCNYNLAQDPNELFDIYLAPESPSQYNSIITSDWGPSYYPSPKPTGKVKERGQVHKDGDWHRSVHVWVAQKDTTNNNVRVLMQRRSKYKDTHPNQLDVSCAGHVNAGDDILETTMRELEEELGGASSSLIRQYTIEDIENSRLFTVSSSIEGKTERFGKYKCQEYQEVFLLWWRGDDIMEATSFAPLVQEEVSGFEILNSNELIQRLRQGDDELVPRSSAYVNALAKVFGCDE